MEKAATGKKAKIDQEKEQHKRNNPVPSPEQPGQGLSRKIFEFGYLVTVSKEEIDRARNLEPMGLLMNHPLIVSLEMNWTVPLILPGPVGIQK